MQPHRRRNGILWTAGLVALMATALFLAWPGIARLRAYGRLTDHPGLRVAFSRVPEEATLPPPAEPAVLSIGYATLSLPVATIRKIESPKESAALRVFTESGNFSFVPPFSFDSVEEFEESTARTEAAFDEAVRQAGLKRLPKPASDPEALERVQWEMRRRIEEPFESAVRIARIGPRTKLQIFLMPDAESLEYFVTAMEKAGDKFTQNGLVIYTGQSVRGILHLGSPQQPGTMFARVFSRDSKVQQGIFVQSEKPEEARRSILELLSGLKYTVSKIPERKALAKILHDAIDAHPQYVEKKED